MLEGSVLLLNILLDDGQRCTTAGRGKVARAPQDILVIPIGDGRHTLPEHPGRYALETVDQFGELDLRWVID